MRKLAQFGLYLGIVAFFAADANAQRISSPRGEAATQIGEDWIVVDYGRPILRGRKDIFAQGDAFGDLVTGVAPVWRAGANKSTRLMTDTALMFGDVEVPAGEYSLFVDLNSAEDWMLIVSEHEAKNSGRESGDGLWGAYGYTADKDVVRVPMAVAMSEHSVDQFTISFLNITESGGTVAMSWGHTTAAVEFALSN